MRTQQTFWNLLSEYEIKIPPIQRDYAQGRENRRTKQIRENFIRSLYRVLEHDKQSIDLDYIYGSDNSKKLILLDGQQRITTLFLLHWYVAQKSGNLNDAVQKKLKRFSYETRSSSRDFCIALIENKISTHFVQASLAEAIKDSHWFYLSWLKDPTIKSMLVMLDAIHKAFKDIADNSLWTRLIDDENRPITFHFLNMDDFELTNDLYIKMNARGKTLSDFETFKAWLQGYVENKKIAPARLNYSEDVLFDWKFRIDREWTDLFWNYRSLWGKPKAEINEIDDALLGYFKGMVLCTYAEKLKINSNKIHETEAILISLFIRNYYIALNDYEKMNCFTRQSLCTMFSVLEYFSINQHKLNLEIRTLFKNFVSPSNNYTDRVLFYALVQYLIKVSSLQLQDKAFFESELSCWLRITRNLAQNTQIDNPGSFIRAVQSIKKLASQLLTCQEYEKNFVYNNMEKLEKKEIRYFSQDQREEEIIKSELILSDIGWENLFEKYEKHEYLYGQIGFLLHLSKNKENDQFEIKKFAEYAEKISNIFKEKLLKHNEHIVERALLSKGDYLIEAGPNFSFCSPDKNTLRVREENWRKVFKDNERPVSYTHLTLPTIYSV